MFGWSYAKASAWYIFAWAATSLGRIPRVCGANHGGVKLLDGVGYVLTSGIWATLR